jgi:hypothetical protein
MYRIDIHVYVYTFIYEYTDICIQPFIPPDRVGRVRCEYYVGRKSLPSPNACNIYVYGFGFFFIFQAEHYSDQCIWQCPANNKKIKTGKCTKISFTLSRTLVQLIITKVINV